MGSVDFLLTMTIGMPIVMVMNTTAPRFRCQGCGHTFRSESIPTGPEGCPECAGFLFEEEPTPPPASTRPVKAAGTTVRWTNIERFGFADGDALARVTYEMIADGWGGFGERRCIEAKRLGAPVTASPASLPCPAGCDDGEAVYGVGETCVCSACRGSGLARCTICIRGVAIAEDGEELVCAHCAREIADDEARDRAIVALSALLLRAFAAKLGLAPRHRACMTPPPPQEVPALPAFVRHDRDSKSWRLARENVVETVRPGQVSP